MVRKLVVLVVVLLAAGWLLAVYVTPWPSVLVTRYIFDRGAAQASAALAPLVPADVVASRGLGYDPDDAGALLDIYRGANANGRPAVVWFHGGGFVSGRRGDIENYLRILAGRGFTVVNVDYAIAPGARYPGPVRQANRALAYLEANRAGLALPEGGFVLAGDSAGSQIAAQTAAMITNPAYAALLGIEPGVPADRLAGALLFCGVYDLGGIGRGGGVMGWFVHSAGWAYSGNRRWRDDDRFATMSLTPHVSAEFPPAFISAGNADPLEPQSRALAATLRERGVPVTALFYPGDYAPPLGHEYQFDLGIAAGKASLEHAVAWLASL
jgi:acetyl esterase